LIQRTCFSGEIPQGCIIIHIIVKSGQATLEGVAVNDADKNVAGIIAK
jgi:hypothetical protein